MAALAETDGLADWPTKNIYRIHDKNGLLVGGACGDSPAEAVAKFNRAWPEEGAVLAVEVVPAKKALSNGRPDHRPDVQHRE